MADKTIQEIVGAIAPYKTNPSAMVRTLLDVTNDITEGKVVIANAANPWTNMLESMVATTSLTIEQLAILHRAQFSTLSTTYSDLYKHLADEDYINCFSSPAAATFTIGMSYIDIQNSVLPVAGKDYSMVTIPRDSEFRANNIAFTIQYPIEIKLYNNGLLLISFVNDKVNPVGSITNNIINYWTTFIAENDRWVFFEIKPIQYEIRSFTSTSEKSITFEENYILNDQFYYARVWHRGTQTNNEWRELATTHSDSVFDPYLPTAVLKVEGKSLGVWLPSVYITNSLVGSEIRTDIYETKGALYTDFSKLALEEFSYDFKAIDAADETIYVSALSNISCYVISKDLVSGGKDALTFEELRLRTVNDSNGNQEHPITAAKIAAKSENNGFKLVAEVDSLTNRIYLAQRSLPKPFNKKLLTSANIGINTTQINAEMFTPGNVSNYKASLNGSRLTLLSGLLLEHINGITKVVPLSDQPVLSNNQLVIDSINNRKLLYTPFYYVLDSTSQEFSLRAYHLDDPYMSRLNFQSMNQTLRLAVNTESYSISKVSTGYKITVKTRSGPFYKAAPDASVGIYLSVVPVGEDIEVFFKGELNNKGEANNDSAEREYEFLVNTNHDLDEKDQITLTNATYFDGVVRKAVVGLEQSWSILHTTTQVAVEYTPSDLDVKYETYTALTGESNAREKISTHEHIQVTLGQALSNLWSRSRTLAGDVQYVIHSNDVALIATETVYEKNADNTEFTIVDNEVVWNRVIFNIGDPVTNSDGTPIYKHRKGDLVLDAAGNPIPLSNIGFNREVDLLVIDGRYFYATEQAYVEYRKEIAKTISSWITDELIVLQKNLLEQTKIFFYPETTLGSLTVKPNKETTIHIGSEQTIEVVFDVDDLVYNDLTLRKLLVNSTIQIVDDYLRNSTVNISELHDMIKAYAGKSVYGLTISGLGGSENYRMLVVEDMHSTMCVKKTLSVQADGTTIIVENVNVKFNVIG